MVAPAASRPRRADWPLRPAPDWTTTRWRWRHQLFDRLGCAGDTRFSRPRLSRIPIRIRAPQGFDRRRPVRPSLVEFTIVAPETRVSRIWKPSVTVAAVAEREGRFLLVEEHTEDGLRNQSARRTPGAG